MSTKISLRKQMRALLKSAPPALFHSAGRALAVSVPSLPIWEAAQEVLLFYPTAEEIDTFPLLDAVLSSGKAAYYPKIEGKDMAFYRVDSRDGPWRTGAFDLTEPADTADGRALDASSLLIITPALAYDRQRRRLGRGGGFYDRFIAQLSSLSSKSAKPWVTVGVCTESQIIDEIPVDPWDRAVDVVCTESNSY